MRVAVTEKNIIEYGLDKITGNTKEELLSAAARAAEFNQVLHVRIPDVEGGDTETPTERNTFEHYSDMPDPDGHSHEQKTIGVSPRTKLRLTQKSVDELHGMAVADGLTEPEWDYWLENAVEIVENPYG